MPARQACRRRGNHARRIFLNAIAFGCALSFLFPACAGEEKSQSEERYQLARNFNIYDFEPRGDSPKSRDRDGDGWPDYWVSLFGEEYPDDLKKDIRIVSDQGRPGLYRYSAGHVLQMPFDGRKVAIQTRVPKVIDPALAYEITAWGKTEGLNLPNTDKVTTYVRIWVIWLHVEEGSNDVELDRDAILVPPGQVDWPEEPLRKRFNDVPADANAVRIMLEISDNPDIPGADRHGWAWFDDIRIETRPKLSIPPVFKKITSDVIGAEGLLDVNIEYLGLIENMPDPDNPARFKGKDYSRVIEVTDMFGEHPTDLSGQPVMLNFNRTEQVNPGPARGYSEVLHLNLQKLGVYYVSVKLFGHRGAVETSVSQAVGLMKAPFQRRAADEVGLQETTGGFEIHLGAPPEAILQKDEGLLAELVKEAAVRQVKVDLWPPYYKPQDESQPYLEALKRELRSIRGSGVRITGVISNTAQPFRLLGMREVMKEKTDSLLQHLQAAVTHVGPHIEFWQWGDDDDPSFSRHVDEAGTGRAREGLKGMVTAMVQIFPLDLADPNALLPDPDLAQAVEVHVPLDLGDKTMTLNLARLFPPIFKRLSQPGKYPDAALAELAPKIVPGATPPPAEAERSQEAWVSVSLNPVERYERSAPRELQQLEDMTIKAIVAKAIGFPRICLGKMFVPGGGMAVLEKNGSATPRPSFLAARTLEEHLGSGSYIGSFQMRDDYSNYVFQQRNGEAVVALWYNGSAKTQELPRLEIGSIPLMLIDMSGNKSPIRDRTITVRRSPILITGMSAALAKTRMSIDIAKIPALESRHEMQRQTLAMSNYFTGQQVLVELQLKYAADALFQRERNWMVRPQQIRDFNLPAAKAGQPAPTGKQFFEVEPNPNSVFGFIEYNADKLGGVVWPLAEGKVGQKYVQLTVDLNTGNRVRMQILRKTRLASDLEVKVVHVDNQADPQHLNLQMQVKWFPDDTLGRSEGKEILLVPYYRKKSDLKAKLSGITVPMYNPLDDETPARTVKFRIPRFPLGSAVIGLDEEGGSRFFIIDITDLLQPRE
jgi:hypothetical protein